MPQRPLAFTWASMLLVAVIGVWGWSIQPELAGRFALRIFLLPIVWGLIELAFSSADVTRRPVREIQRWHRSVFAWVSLIVAVGLGAQVAISAGVLDAEWAPIARRIRGVLFGVGLAIWGNYLPKVISPWSPVEEPFDWQRVHRFTGWLSLLSGVAVALVWLTLPMDTARAIATALTATFVVTGVGRKMLSVSSYSRRRPSTMAMPTRSGAE
jgi:hypothetical protein